MIVRPIIPALRMIRLENFEFKASLSNTDPASNTKGKGWMQHNCTGLV